MQIYNAPLRDMRFVLHELHDFAGLCALPAFRDLDGETIDRVLEQAAALATGILLPLNASGDAEGCLLESGVVRTPSGFKEAYLQFREGGWTALPEPVEHGGQGLPESVNKLVEEMVCAANLSFSLYPGLTHGATKALKDHGSAALIKTYLPKMVSGEWSGAMCLTEAHCGTDLGLLRTRATLAADGSYRIDGTKIFISAGDHDLTDNVIHLVLARIEGAPGGTKGISLFLVPKLLPDAHGNAGTRNGVICTRLEHKMGLKASATCELMFENAQGWLLGAPNKGMQAMFTMMNAERLAVGIQGVGIAEASYQGAVFYARERLQGRAVNGPQHPGRAADPIIVHPDVRRMLMNMRVYVEGCRAMGIWVSRAIDVASHAEDAAVRGEAADFVALMTPVVKALFTDLGFEAANLGLQVYGGHGYVRDHGMEQYVRDARITMIYEGTNGIQALDLVGRKLPAHMGRLLRRFFHPVSDLIAQGKQDPKIVKLAEALERAFGALQMASAQIARTGLADAEEAGAAASDYLRLLGLIGMGAMWLRSAGIAHARLADPGSESDADFYRAKLVSAQYFADRILPQTAALFLCIRSGKASMMALEPDAF